jgi:hypothetical protein
LLARQARMIKAEARQRSVSQTLHGCSPRWPSVGHRTGGQLSGQE